MIINHIFDNLSDNCVPYDQVKNCNWSNCIYIYSVSFILILLKSFFNGNVHTHHRKSFYLINLFGFRSKYNFENIFHTVHNPPHNYSNFYINLLKRYPPKNIIFNSENTKNEFLKLDKKFVHSTVINNGIDIQKLKTVECIKKNKQNYTILFSGRDVEQKNLVFLLDILKKIESEISETLEVIIISDLSLNSSHEVFQSKKILFTFYNNLRQLELWQIIKTVDLCIVPSIYEGYGNYQMEVSILNENLLLSDIRIHKEFYNSKYFLKIHDFKNSCNLVKSVILKEVNSLGTVLKDVNSHDRIYIDEKYKVFYGIK